MNAKRFFFVMLALILLATAGCGAGYYWVEGRLKTRADKVSDLLAERDAQADKISKLQVSKNSLQNGTKIIALINSLLPNQKSQENLVADIIYTVTQQAGISANQISSISFTGTGAPNSLSGTTLLKDIQGVYAYPFNMQLRDISYETMLKLFSEIEKNKRIIQADQVSISPDKNRQGYITSIALSLKTFVQP